MDGASRVADGQPKTDRRLHVGILGATGVVGQRFIQLLENHKWFQLSVLGASDRSTGKLLSEAATWRLSAEMPAFCSELRIVDCDPCNFSSCDLVFSALDSAAAGPIEAEFSRQGIPVFTNASNHRTRTDVPVLLPLVNPQQIALAQVQQQRNRAEQQSCDPSKAGFIITNGNCASTILCVVLAPILELFPDNRVRAVVVSTLQAISGAGYPGLPSSDIMDNVIPFIAGEEDKIETEPCKVLGKLNGDRIQEASLPISAMVHRVPVIDGHMLSVSLNIAPENTATVGQEQDTAFKQTCSRLIYERLQQFEAPSDVQNLPSCPRQPIIVRPESNRPQSRLDRLQENGMAVVVGGIRPCSVNTVKFTAVGHNAILGAAGCSILNAEFALRQKLIPAKDLTDLL